MEGKAGDGHVAEDGEGAAPMDAEEMDKEDDKAGQCPSASSAADDKEVDTTKPTSTRRRTRAPKTAEDAHPKKKAKKDIKDGENPEEPKKPKKRVRSDVPATFARRGEPSSVFGLAKWKALRSAFEKIVKPHLATYSAAEDCAVERFWAPVNPIITSSHTLSFKQL